MLRQLELVVLERPAVERGEADLAEPGGDGPLTGLPRRRELGERPGGRPVEHVHGRVAVLDRGPVRHRRLEPVAAGLDEARRLEDLGDVRLVELRPLLVAHAGGRDAVDDVDRAGHVSRPRADPRDLPRHRAPQEAPAPVLDHELVVVAAERRQRRRVALATAYVHPQARGGRAIAVDRDLGIGDEVPERRARPRRVVRERRGQHRVDALGPRGLARGAGPAAVRGVQRREGAHVADVERPPVLLQEVADLLLRLEHAQAAPRAPGSPRASRPQLSWSVIRDMPQARPRRVSRRAAHRACGPSGWTGSATSLPGPGP